MPRGLGLGRLACFLPSWYSHLASSLGITRFVLLKKIVSTIIKINPLFLFCYCMNLILLKKKKAEKELANLHCEKVITSSEIVELSIDCKRINFTDLICHNNSNNHNHNHNRASDISQKKSQNSQKNRLISRDFSGKESNFEGFSGANS